jgi:hypothetical protein
MSLRFWIALSSMVGFLGGWALLAHSPKPAQLVQQPALVEPALLPTLAPFPALGTRNRNLQQLPALRQRRGSFPRLQTGGS